MTRFSQAGFVFATVLILGTVAIGKDPAQPAKRLTEADNGKSVKVTVGDVVTIALRSNPTTGYSWQTAKIDNTVLEQVGNPKYKGDPNPEGKDGVGGTFTLTLKAIKTGKGEVRLTYVQQFPQVHLEPQNTGQT